MDRESLIANYQKKLKEHDDLENQVRNIRLN